MHFTIFYTHDAPTFETKVKHFILLVMKDPPIFKSVPGPLILTLIYISGLFPGEAFKWIVVHSIALTIMVYIVPLLK